uniref:Uncharacterized protein n=1 Tax=Panagrolaimus sp. PS1159 TaxID=55785 RepID=A0AC35ERQ1_9BILA
MGIFSLIYEYVWWFITSYFMFRFGKFLYIVSQSIYGHFFSTPYDLTPLLDKWTVVTGCTDGIGRAYIEELAKTRGVRKFYLIARNKSKLEKVKEELGEFAIMGIFSLIYEYVWWFITSYFMFRFGKFLYIVSQSIYGHFFSTPYDLTPLLDKWTVVTGCTDGTGRAYIEELAKTRGVRKFYLIARNKSKLEKVKEELESRYKAEIKTAIFDFENDEYTKLPEELKTIEAGILEVFSPINTGEKVKTGNIALIFL